LHIADSRFLGRYNKKQVHRMDMFHILDRARQFGVKGFVFHAYNVKDAKECISIAKRVDNSFVKIGLAPRSAEEIFKGEKLRNSMQIKKAVDDYFNEMRKVIEKD
jgi:Tat protein secretion system quality control protein TatD with DNase activity